MVTKWVMHPRSIGKSYSRTFMIVVKKITDQMTILKSKGLEPDEVALSQHLANICGGGLTEHMGLKVRVAKDVPDDYMVVGCSLRLSDN